MGGRSRPLGGPATRSFGGHRQRVRERAVVPLRFATVFPSDRGLVPDLRREGREPAVALDRSAGLAEWTLTVSWDPAEVPPNRWTPMILDDRRATGRPTYRRSRASVPPATVCGRFARSSLRGCTPSSLQPRLPLNGDRPTARSFEVRTSCLDTGHHEFSTRDRQGNRSARRVGGPCRSERAVAADARS